MRNHISIITCFNRFIIFLLCLVFFLASFGCNSSNRYDYTDQSLQIDAIYYIEVTGLDFRDKSGKFEYEILETIDTDKKDAILQDLSGLEYRTRPEPHSLGVGDHGLLLCYNESSSELHYVLFCQSIVNEWYRTNTGDEYKWHYGVTDSDSWNNLLDKYLIQKYNFRYR